MDEQTEQFPVKHWLYHRVLFTAEITCRPDASIYVKLGLAVKWGHANGASLVGARLVGARLDGASLDGASLVGARLDGASLDGARLDGASLDGASLDGASLVGARLDGASLDGASLVGASLVGARLDGASLVGASLDGASLDGARLDKCEYRPGVPMTKVPVQLQGIGPWPVLIFDRHMKIGCQLHTLNEWEMFDDRTIIGMDGRRAAQFWKANKAALMALARAHGRDFN